MRVGTRSVGRRRSAGIIASSLILLVVQSSYLPTKVGADRVFNATIQPVPQPVRASMVGASWHQGCPVAIDDLAYIRLTYWGFDHAAHTGILVMHRNLARETVDIFRELFEIRFPIERMQPYETFAIGKFAENDDTTGFYCRPDQGDPNRFGMHSYGYAIDINPALNPYLDEKQGWWPPGSAPQSSRDDPKPGKITTHSTAFMTFTRHGWLWGGLFRGHPDYMHFEKGTVGAHPSPIEAPYVIDSLRYQLR